MYKRKIYDQLLHWKNTSNGKTAVLKDWFFFSLLQHIPLPSICTPEALLMAYKKSWQKLLTLSLKCGILPLERYSKENASRRKNILRIIYEIWSRRSGRRYFRWSL